MISTMAVALALVLSVAFGASDIAPGRPAGGAPAAIASAVNDPGEQAFPGQTTAGHVPDWSISLAVRDAN